MKTQKLNERCHKRVSLSSDGKTQRKENKLFQKNEGIRSAAICSPIPMMKKFSESVKKLYTPTTKKFELRETTAETDQRTLSSYRKILEITRSTENNLNTAFIIESPLSTFQNLAPVHLFNSSNTSSYLPLSQIPSSFLDNLDSIFDSVSSLTFFSNYSSNSEPSTKPQSTQGDLINQVDLSYFNHKLLPLGKENNENFKINLINKKLKKIELPPYSTDFCRKRTYMELSKIKLILSFFT